jgi:hypothetical protein
MLATATSLAAATLTAHFCSVQIGVSCSRQVEPSSTGVTSTLWCHVDAGATVRVGRQADWLHVWEGAGRRLYGHCAVTTCVSSLTTGEPCLRHAMRVRYTADVLHGDQWGVHDRPSTTIVQGGRLMKPGHAWQGCHS